MPDKTIHPLGQFELKSGQLIITDPCYYHENEDKGEAALAGIWQAQLIKTLNKTWGNRCAALWIYHQDYRSSFDEAKWIDLDTGTGVDSGQAGFFDAQYFADESIVTEVIEQPLTGENKWYDLCCDRTLNSLGAGIIPYGVVSTSGCGDGYYKAYGQYDGDELVAVGLDFEMLYPITFVPKADGDEVDFFDALRDNDLESTTHLLAQNPSLAQVSWLMNIALYYNRIEALQKILQQRGDSMDLDIYYIVSTEKVATLEALQPYITHIDQEEDIFSSLSYNNQGFRFSKLLYELGLNPNPNGKSVLKDFCRSLSDEKAPMLAFWLDKGMRCTTRDFPKEWIATNKYTGAGIKQLLLDHYDDFASPSFNFEIGFMVKILDGPFKNFEGKIVAINGDDYSVETEVFGRKTPVQVKFEQMEAL